jgi:dTDP-4-dehydrorhamnose reductase
MGITNMPTNILVTGAKGQLGSELRYLSENEPSLCEHFNFIFADRKILDITSQSAIEQLCVSHNVHVIINCAAYTAVDKAEVEQDAAYSINHHAVENLASIAKKKSIKLIHISTDYVFDGKNYKPYIETDTPNPQNIYGKSKLAGEQAMQSINPENSIIIRTSWVYSSFGNNFVKTILRLGQERDELNVVVDQIGSPTYARDLARAILQIIPQLNNRNVEIFHYSNEGVCSWYDFAKAIFEVTEIDCKVSAIPGSDYPKPAIRPFYSVLNKSKIETNFSAINPHWRCSMLNMLEVALQV